MEKLTIAKKFEMVKAILDAQGEEMLANFIEDEKAKVVRKNSNRKPTKTQQDNEILFKAIFDFLTESGRRMAIKDMIKEIPECEGLSTSKVSGVIRPHKDTLIGRTEEKGVALFFALAEVEGE